MDSLGQGLSIGAGWASPQAAGPARATLPSGALQRLPTPARVRVLRGTLWLTVDGEPADIVLEPGDNRLFAARQRVLACALGGAAAFEWTPPDSAPTSGTPATVGAVGMNRGGLASAWTSFASWARRLRRPWLARGAGA